MGRIELCAYLPAKLVPIIQPHLKLAFLEPDDNPEYIDYYRKYRGVKILDNGLIEFGKSISPRRLIEYARMVDATFIIPPDKIGDWDYNFYSAKEFCYDFHSDTHKLLVCLGGPGPTDFISQANQTEDHHFGGMCLPFRTNRIALQVFPHSRLHLLGLKWPEEYKSYITRNPQVHLSLDTTEFVNAAYEEKNYAEEGFTTTKRTRHYRDLSEHTVDCRLLWQNLNWLQEQMTYNENK